MNIEGELYYLTNSISIVDDVIKCDWVYAKYDIIPLSIIDEYRLIDVFDFDGKIIKDKKIREEFKINADEYYYLFDDDFEFIFIEGVISVDIMLEKSNLKKMLEKKTYVFSKNLNDIYRIKISLYEMALEILGNDKEKIIKIINERKNRWIHKLI